MNDDTNVQLAKFPPEDIARLERLLGVLRRVDGWCAVNRAIAKYVIFTVIATLVILSQGWDAISRAYNFIRGH